MLSSSRSTGSIPRIASPAVSSSSTNRISWRARLLLATKLSQHQSAPAKPPALSEGKHLSWALFFFRPEHPRGGSSDEATRNQALPVRAKIIPKPRDDIALPRSQCAQAGLRHFLRALSPVDEFVLPRYNMKLRFCRARTQRANANSVRLHLFRQAFCKKQIKSLRSRVRGNIGHGLKRSRGCKNQNIAAPS